MFKANGLLTVENILSNISPLDIYSKYSDYFKVVGKHFKSDFRKDPNPSAIIYQYNGTFLYKDFGESGALNCFQFVSRKFNLTFKEVLEKINNDFYLNLGATSNIPSNYVKKTYNKIETSEFKTIITVKKIGFRELDLEWWGNQAWTLNMLKAAKISPISHYRLTSERWGIDEMLYLCEDYSYTMDYYWSNGIFRRKLYFPKREKHKKWVSNVDKTIIQGWDLLPKSGEICFITSSFKDTAPFWRLYGKPCAIAPNNEGSFIPEKVFYKLKNRYKHIVIFFNNDEAGILGAKKYSQKYNIQYIYNPIGSPKDPTDFVKSYDNPDIGLREFNYYLQRGLSVIIN